ncbi:MAG: hypothetical protein WAL63_12680 [Solirubrobacteraceae bacterium]
MSARFTVNFVVLLLGAGLVVVAFAFSSDTLSWVGVGVGATAVVAGLANFALRHQGLYQRIADVLVVAVGAWAIVAARVLSDRTRWTEFAAGVALAALGALGLLVREIRLGRGLQVGGERIRTDQFADLSALQRDAEVQR